MQSETCIQSDLNPWQAGIRSARRRLPGMLVAWAAIGVAVGTLTAPNSGRIGIVAGVIAGLIVMTPVGVMLTLAGGRGRDSAFGGVIGLALVPGVVRLGDLPLTQVSPVPFGIIVGALIGTTAATAFYRLPKLILSAGGWPRPTGLKRP